MGALSGAFWGLLIGLIFFAPIFGLAIGKAGKNIFKAKILAQRQHDIADVQLVQNETA